MESMGIRMRVPQRKETLGGTKSELFTSHHTKRIFPDLDPRGPKVLFEKGVGFCLIPDLVDGEINLSKVSSIQMAVLRSGDES